MCGVRRQTERDCSQGQFEKNNFKRATSNNGIWCTSADCISHCTSTDCVSQCAPELSATWARRGKQSEVDDSDCSEQLESESGSECEDDYFNWNEEEHVNGAESCNYLSTSAPIVDLPIFRKELTADDFTIPTREQFATKQKADIELKQLHEVDQKRISDFTPAAVPEVQRETLAGKTAAQLDDSVCEIRKQTLSGLNPQGNSEKLTSNGLRTTAGTAVPQPIALATVPQLIASADVHLSCLLFEPDRRSLSAKSGVSTASTSTPMLSTSSSSLNQASALIVRSVSKAMRIKEVIATMVVLILITLLINHHSGKSFKLVISIRSSNQQLFAVHRTWFVGNRDDFRKKTRLPEQIKSDNQPTTEESSTITTSAPGDALTTSSKEGRECMSTPLKMSVETGSSKTIIASDEPTTSALPVTLASGVFVLFAATTSCADITLQQSLIAAALRDSIMMRVGTVGQMAPTSAKVTASSCPMFFLIGATPPCASTPFDGAVLAPSERTLQMNSARFYSPKSMPTSDARSPIPSREWPATCSPTWQDF